jgi:tight adherence protein C
MSMQFTLASLMCGVCVGSLTFLVARQFAEVTLARTHYKVKVPLMFRLCLPVARLWAPRIRKNPSFKGWLDSEDSRLTMAGLTQTYTPAEFIGLKLCTGIIFTVVGLVLLNVGGGRVLGLMALIFLCSAWIYPALWLRGIIKERHKAIQRSLPNVLDLLTLSVEAGRDFLTALKDILRNRAKDTLGEELEQVFREVQLGKQRRHALLAMSDRVRQPDLSTVVETLVQADQLGVSIGHILRVLGDQMRAKRFSLAEKKANESPVKLLFPLFAFIFPAVLIIMLGPIILKAIQANAL